MLGLRSVTCSRARFKQIVIFTLCADALSHFSIGVHMRALLIITLVVAVVDALGPEEGHAARIFSNGRATLQLANALDPEAAGTVVPIRTRSQPWKRIVFASHVELPEYIGGPQSTAFPLVAHVSNATADGESCAADVPVPLAEWADVAAQVLSTKLVDHGAVLLRGLPIANSADYNEFIGALEPRVGWTAVKLGGGGTQRKDLQAKVRTASEEPAEHTIEPHMDMAHSVAHPKRIAFFCAAGPPKGVGGETVLSDMRRVYATLAQLGIPEQFAAHGGVAYRKRLWSAEKVSHSYTWQQFFFTQERESAVDEVRRRDPKARVDEATGRIDFEEHLPAVWEHPTTGEPLWFNGVHTNHKSYYEEAEHVDTSDGSPMHTAYADGAEIPETTIATVRAAVWNHSVAVRCQTGDVIVVDNMLAAHGRMGWISGNQRQVLLTHFQ